MKLLTMIQICRKDILLLLRDKGALFFTLAFPLIMAIFFGTVFSGGGPQAGISLAIADQDNSIESRAYIKTLSDSNALRVQLLDEDIATENVRKGKISAVLVIPEGFGAARESLFDGDTPTIQLGIDPSRKAVAGILEGLLMAQAAKDMQDKFTDTSQLLKEVDTSLNTLQAELINEPELAQFLGSLRNWMEFLETEEILAETTETTEAKDENSEVTNTGFQGFTPMIINHKDVKKKNSGPKNAYAISFPQGMVWGIIGAISTFSLALVTEARAGTLSRLSSAPISRMSILGGKAMACFLTITMVMSLLIAVGVLVFGINIYSWPVLIVSILSAAIGFSGLMMLLSVIGKTEKAAAGLGSAIVLIMAMTGGGMIPIMLMPNWMATIGDFSPIKWAVISFEGSLWRQFSLVELLPSTGLLLAMGVITFILGSYIFNKREIS